MAGNRSSSRGLGPGSRLSRGQILDAAMRHFDLGETQASIAADLGVSASHLARLLKKAKADGWVRVFVDADREAELAAQIKQKYPKLKRVEVVPSGSTAAATARALGTVAADYLNELLDQDELLDEPQIRSIAIGGGMVHQEMVPQVARRRNRVSVGPTSLTPSLGRVGRHTAPMVARALAHRLGALVPGQRAPGALGGSYYEAWVRPPPPSEGLKGLRRWYQELEGDPAFEVVRDFWRRLDVVFVGVVDIDWRYSDTAERLEALGTSVHALRLRGGGGFVANSCFDSSGSLVPLGPGVPGIEPAVQLDDLASGNTAYRVLDAWGPPSGSAGALVRAGIVNVLLCDTIAADHLLRG